MAADAIFNVSRVTSLQVSQRKGDMRLILTPWLWGRCMVCWQGSYWDPSRQALPATSQPTAPIDSQRDLITLIHRHRRPPPPSAGFIVDCSCWQRHRNSIASAAGRERQRSVSILTTQRQRRDLQLEAAHNETLDSSHFIYYFIYRPTLHSMTSILRFSINLQK